LPRIVVRTCLRPVVVFLAFLSVSLVASCSAAGDSPLIDIQKVAPGIQVDIRYATPENFTGQILYPLNRCLLCEPVAHRLALVQSDLEKEGLGLKVWDCYRPLSVQKKLWKIVPDERYVADPKTGSRHNRGASVDLTLVDRAGRELVMPTKFDEFTERAHRNYQNLPAEALRNRAKLEAAMTTRGFTGLPTEWWHFDDPEWSHFAIRDEPLGSPALETDQPASLEMPFPRESSQLVLVVSPEWSSVKATLQRFEKTGAGWKAVGSSWPVTLGKNGLRWGRGLQGPASLGPAKSESDRTAPAGLFRIGRAYGYAPHPPAGCLWPYQPVTEDWFCVDDPKSRSYNQILRLEPGAPRDWKSAETLRRSDHLYTWFLNVEQNWPDVKEACGSCIFLHVWRTPDSPTDGCTAMEESRMVELLRWLSPEAHPCLVQLPEAVYRPLKAKGLLP